MRRMLLALLALFSLGALASGYAWEPLGAALTFTLAAVAALAGMVLLWWKLPIQEQ